MSSPRRLGPHPDKETPCPQSTRPIFILSRRPRSDTRWPLVTYVDDIRTAMSEAKRAAGDENVLVHGAGIAQLALDELERTRILAGEGGVTHMHCRVRY